jgi:hypothetical protein
MSITVEAIKALPDDDLDRFIATAAEEKKERTEREKQETIARIKQLAGAVGVRIAIGGARGRPANGTARHKKAGAAPANATPVKKTG